MKRFRCLGCKLSDKPHWHADSVRPALQVRYRPRGTGDGIVFDLGAAMGFPTRSASETTRALLEVIAEEKAVQDAPSDDGRFGRLIIKKRTGEVLRLGFPGILLRATIRQVENSQGQRTEARWIAKERREQAALVRDASWRKHLSALGLFPFDAPDSISKAARELERREDGRGALEILKKRRNIEASPLYSPKRRAAGSPVKGNSRSAASRADDRMSPSIQGKVDIRRVAARGRKKKH